MSEQIKDGGPAFPHHDGSFGGAMDSGTHGMTLRDYFAAKATEQDIAQWREGKNCGHYMKRTREQAKFAYADAMLRAREQQP